MFDTHTAIPPTAPPPGPPPGRATAGADSDLEPVLTLGAPQPRQRLWFVVPAIAAVAVVLGLGGWWYATAGPGAYTTVPAGLVGADLSRVESVLADAGLEVTTAEVFDPTAPAGQVLSVLPAQAERIHKGGAVALTVSKGPDLRAVSVEPAGSSVDDVEAALVAAGFEVGETKHVYSDTVPAGTVIRAFDADGNLIELGGSFPVGTVITLTCSDGLAPVTVPTVVGMARADAVAALTALGLAVTESEAYSPDVPAGIVKAQDPPGESAGHRLDTVAIVVSLGAEPPPPPVEPVTVVIPSSIIGMTKFPALDLLAAKGFNGKYERNTCTVEWAQCVVTKTVPAAGTRQAKGSTVTIWLTNPAGATGIVPSLVGLPKYTAWQQIADAGFTGVHYDEGCTNLVAEPGNYDLCVVQEQWPAAGTSLPTGSTVKIWLKNA